ncbi:MAG TPA: hypothetical protein VF285_08695 [Castellaniella sp.]|uniref:hypothetical protein n=1 Tax=Castellaniella sp. TaxID=1955812 RepID=UPI002EFD4430
MMTRTLLPLLACLALAGCANIANTPAGTPLAQVEAKFGTPTLQCTNRQGQQRVIWSQQPLGQFAWGGNVDPDGRVQTIAPILTDEHFQVLAHGTWTPDQVRCEFGPPAFIDEVGLPSVRQIVWNYRYKQDHVWNSLMFVYFDRDVSHVTHFNAGPDPMYDHEERSHW